MYGDQFGEFVSGYQGLKGLRTQLASGKPDGYVFYKCVWGVELGLQRSKSSPVLGVKPKTWSTQTQDCWFASSAFLLLLDDASSVS